MRFNVWDWNHFRPTDRPPAPCLADPPTFVVEVQDVVEVRRHVPLGLFTKAPQRLSCYPETDSCLKATPKDAHAPRSADNRKCTECTVLPRLLVFLLILRRPRFSPTFADTQHVLSRRTNFFEGRVLLLWQPAPRPQAESPGLAAMGTHDGCGCRGFEVSGEKGMTYRNEENTFQGLKWML